MARGQRGCSEQSEWGGVEEHVSRRGGEGDPFVCSLNPSRTKSRISSHSEPTSWPVCGTGRNDQDRSVLRVGSALETTSSFLVAQPPIDTSERDRLCIWSDCPRRSVAGMSRPLSVSQAMCNREILTIKIFLSPRHSSTVSNQFGGRGVWGGKYQRTSKRVSLPDFALFQGSRNLGRLYAK